MQSNTSDTKWDDVRVFLAVYREKSLSSAAKRLGVDTSTVSRRVAALEAALGGALFERTREGLTSTRAAERVLPAAEAMELAQARLTRDASDTENLAEGRVRISVAPGLADIFIAPALVRLRARHPGLAIELDASVRPVDLTRREADLALRSVKPAGADLVVTKLGTAQWHVAGAPSLAKKLGVLRAWTDAPWIGWDRDLASFAPARWLAERAPKADIALRTSHFSSQLSAARAGLGLVLVPEAFARVLGLDLVRLSKTLAAEAATSPTDTLWLVGHRLLRDVPRIAAVWTFLAEEIRTSAFAEVRSRRSPSSSAR